MLWKRREEGVRSGKGQRQCRMQIRRGPGWAGLKMGDQGHGEGDFRADCPWGRRLEDKALGRRKGSRGLAEGLGAGQRCEPVGAGKLEVPP